MQCPRCGLQNNPGITACARCGLPAPQAPGQPTPFQAPHTGRPSRPQPYAPPYGGPVQPPHAGQPSRPQPYAPPYAGHPGPRGAQDLTGLAALIAAAVGALLCLGYAAWAFTARRGIFADFAEGNSVSRDDARSSDTIDTVFLVIAGLVAAVALVLWLARKARHQTSGGGFDAGGLSVCLLGVVTVLVGLVLTGAVTDGDGPAEQGDRGVIATTILGTGFTVLAIGLLLGLIALPSTARYERGETAYGAGGGAQNRPNR